MRISGLFSVVIALSALVNIHEAAAQRRDQPRETFVQCPALQLDAEITVAQAAGWQPPKDRGRLVETHIHNSAGKQVLRCGYQMFDTVVFLSKPAPQNTVGCRAQRRGFMCEQPRRRRGPEVHTIELRKGHSLDMDTSRRSDGIDDVIIQKRGTVKHAWQPINGARFVQVGSHEPSRRACRQARLSDRRIDFSRLNSGQYLCGETSDGRTVRVHIDRIKSRLFSNAKITISYTVWPRRRR